MSRHPGRPKPGPRQRTRNPAWVPGLGIILLIVGLALRWKTTVVVLLAALTTGLACGVGPVHLLEVLGKGFVDNRILSLFLLTLPTIGMCERYGLREQVSHWVRGLQTSRPGRILVAYQWFRVLMGVLGLRLSGHPGFVRPLVAPMVCAAAPDQDPDHLKAAAAAAENYGNFYGQNLSPIAPGLLLVLAILKENNCPVELGSLVLMALVPVACSLVLGGLQLWRR